jgi:hypothetical protein
MIKFLKKCCESKREYITYVVVFFWIILGITASNFNTNFTDLAAYFISLTGFVTAYIFGESVRRSDESSIFMKGKNSKREAMTYFIMLIWLIIGLWCVVNEGDLIGISAYFAALTPFVGSYIIGETYKKEDITFIDNEIIQSDEIDQTNS